ncbi:MAG: class I SAM-dependent RNA methyltransferase [Deferribacterales bacterium]
MIFETYIKDTAYGGYGVGTMPDGRVIFLPHTVKGDTVRCDVTDDKKNFCYGEMKTLVKPSELRGEIYCPHIGSCGGCVFGHISYDAQVDIKKNFVLTQLTRAKLELPEPEIFTAEITGFRNRATFRIRDRQIGFYKFKSNDFIPVDACPVIKSTMVEKAKALAAATDGGDYVLYVTENENGEALGRTDAGVADLFGFTGLKASGNVMGERTIAFETKYGVFYAGFDTFLQGNRYLSEKLQDFVYENSMGNTALELYCGTGFLTLPLAKRAQEVTAAEISAQSVSLGRKAGMKNVRWHSSPSESLVGTLRGSFDTILVDPPRTGLDKKTADYIRKSGAKRIIYISCAPDTLARDISRMKDVYMIDKLCIIDMFPGSYHVESAVLLKNV